MHTKDCHFVSLVAVFLSVFSMTHDRGYFRYAMLFLKLAFSWGVESSAKRLMFLLDRVNRFGSVLGKIETEIALLRVHILYYVLTR